MIFSKNRGKMATLIVAISCISLIFSLIPVGAFAENCTHSGDVLTDKISNNDGTHIVYYTCDTCGFDWEWGVESCSLVEYDYYAVCECGYEECLHRFTSEGYSPTCTEEGLSFDYCQRCYISTNESVLPALGHEKHSQPWKCEPNGDRTHTAYYQCVREGCDEVNVIVENEPCFNYDYTYCMCGQKAVDCTHPKEYIDKDYRDNNNGTHTNYEHCNFCYSDFFYDTVPCVGMLDGECDDCGYRSSDYIECDHGYPEYDAYVKGEDGYHIVQVLCSKCHRVIRSGTMPCDYKDLYIDNEDQSTHSYYKYCDCGYRLFVRNEEHFMSGNICTLCDYSKAMVGLLEGVPANAIPGYIYQDSDGRWCVRAESYFGGTNYLNLLLLKPYFFKNSSLEIVEQKANEIIIRDKYGKVNSSNCNIVDFALKEHTWLVPGETYTFSFKVDSPVSSSTLVLAVKDSSGKNTYIQQNKPFIYDSSSTYTFNFKTNSSTKDAYGSAFEVRFYDIQITKGEGIVSFEPFATRYFNNELAYADYQDATVRLSGVVGGYAAAFDYYYNLAYGNNNKTTYKDKVLYSGGSSLLKSFDIYYSSVYGNLIDGKGEYSDLLKKLSASGSGGYMQGYSEGYGAALRDFDDVSDGGFIEGLINGGFSAVSNSWDILSSGVSISGISVGGIVSSAVIFVVAYFALKIISR